MRHCRSLKNLGQSVSASGDTNKEFSCKKGKKDREEKKIVKKFTNKKTKREREKKQQKERVRKTGSKKKIDAEN